MNDDAVEPDLITKSRLKDERGWTDALIREFLGEPDEMTANPYFRSGPKLKLYKVPRVEGVEATELWQWAKRHADRRSKGARKAAKTQQRKLLAKVEELEIKVTKMPLRKARNKAIEHFNNSFNNSWVDPWESWFAPNVPATKDSDPEFLDRITVNFIRHELTHYDNNLNGVKGAPGSKSARAMIKKKVLREIANAYPALAEECAKQWQRRRKAKRTAPPSRANVKT